MRLTPNKCEHECPSWVFASHVLKSHLLGPHHTDDTLTDATANRIDKTKIWGSICLAHTIQITILSLYWCWPYRLKSDLCGPHHTNGNFGARRKQPKTQASHVRRSPFAWPTPSKLQFQRSHLVLLRSHLCGPHHTNANLSVYLECLYLMCWRAVCLAHTTQMITR